MRRQDGFSLLEMVISMGIMLAVTAGVFTVMNPSQGAFQTQPEVSDIQQRLRVASDSLYKDLVMAGGGAYQGQRSGSLLNFFAPILPYRNGSTSDDQPGTYKTDTITIMYVPPTISQTGLADKGPSLNSAEIGVTAEPGCPADDPLCGFKEGMTVMMYDDSGNFDTFTITQVQEGGQLHIQHNEEKLTYTGYSKDTTKIVQAMNVVYYLNTTTNQLMYYDGTRNPDVPVVDNVVGLNFEYYADPQPPIVKNPTAASTLWVTTYGPKPKSGVANCVFDGSAQPVSTLPTLGPANTGLVKMTAAQLSGTEPGAQWCPDAGSTNRYPAALLRIRKVAVTVRVQAALATLRGPGPSALFTRGGTSSSGTKWVPDQEIRFQVTPRNLNLGR
ncbi:MAG TPA: prepilin-type N-terminal cleavage/methylation domain-containing protein [Vicinamibacterales bacterium]